MVIYETIHDQQSLVRAAMPLWILLGKGCLYLLGAYGLALVLKRVSALTGLIFSLMIFTTGAFVDREKLGRVHPVYELVFPLTWGISLMRSLASLARSGELLGLGLHSMGYLLFGLGVFAYNAAYEVTVTWQVTVTFNC